MTNQYLEKIASMSIPTAVGLTANYNHETHGNLITPVRVGLGGALLGGMSGALVGNGVGALVGAGLGATLGVAGGVSLSKHRAAAIEILKGQGFSEAEIALLGRRTKGDDRLTQAARATMLDRVARKYGPSYMEEGLNG